MTNVLADYAASVCKRQDLAASVPFEAVRNWAPIWRGPNTGCDRGAGVLTSGVMTRPAAAEPSEVSPPRYSRPLGQAILVVLGILIVEVLIEGWLVTRMGHRGPLDADNQPTIVTANWP